MMLAAYAASPEAQPAVLVRRTPPEPAGAHPVHQWLGSASLAR